MNWVPQICGENDGTCQPGLSKVRWNELACFLAASYSRKTCQNMGLMQPLVIPVSQDIHSYLRYRISSLWKQAEAVLFNENG